MSEKPDIEAIKARLAASTPGKWEWVGMDIETDAEPYSLMVMEVGDDDKPYGLHSTEMKIREEDKIFIIAAPTDMAALIKAYEDLQAEVALLWKERDEAIVQINAMALSMEPKTNTEG